MIVFKNVSRCGWDRPCPPDDQLNSTEPGRPVYTNIFWLKKKKVLYLELKNVICHFPQHTSNDENKIPAKHETKDEEDNSK